MKYRARRWREKRTLPIRGNLKVVVTPEPNGQWGIYLTNTKGERKLWKRASEIFVKNAQNIQ